MSEQGEKKEILTDEEFEKLATMTYREEDRWYPNADEIAKIKNTIALHEEDMKTVKGLKRFIETGVLVNDQLIVAVQPSEYRTGIFIRAFARGDFETASVAVKVPLNMQDVKRFIAILKESLVVGKKQRQMIKLKKLLEHKRARRYR